LRDRWALLEDRELDTDLIHDRQQLLSRKHLAVVYTIDLASIKIKSIGSNLGTHMDTIIDWRWNVSAAEALVQPLFRVTAIFLRIFFGLAA